MLNLSGGLPRFIETLASWQLMLLVLACVVALLVFVFFLTLIVALLLPQKRVQSMGPEVTPPFMTILLRMGEYRGEVADGLRPFLEQTYSNYELLFVDDGLNEEVTLAFLALSKSHPRLRITTTVADAKFARASKLSLTVALKAAKGEALLLASLDAPPRSDGWLSAYADAIAGGAHVVFGHTNGYPGTPASLPKAAGHLLAMFAQAYSRMGFFAKAPSSCVAFRLASLIEAGEFSGIGHLAGDEANLIASRLAAKGRPVVLYLPSTQVAPTKEARPTWSNYFRSGVMHRQAKAFIHPQMRRIALLNPSLRALTYVVALASLMLPYPGWLLVFALPLLRRIMHTGAILAGMRNLRQRWNPLAIWGYDIFQPLLALRVAAKYHTFKRLPAWR